MSYKEVMVREEVKAAEDAGKMNAEAGTNTQDGLIKLKDDGNVTRQIMNGIGMDSLLTYDENSEQRSGR